MAMLYPGSYDEDEETSQSRAREGGGGASQPAQTFSQLQQQGYARPPQPSDTPNITPRPYSQPGTPTVGTPPPPGPNIGPSNPGGGWADTGQGMMPPGSDPNFGRPVLDPTRQGSTQSRNNPIQDFTGFDPLSRHMQQQYENFNGGPLDSSIQEQLLRALTNPSRYDADAAQQTFRRLSDDIMQGVDVDASRRGVFHSSIPTAIGAREKGNLAAKIAEEQARTYGQDRAQAISQAMGYGSQHFGQQQELFRNLLGYGQQSFDNQLRQNQFNSDNEFRNSQLEQQLYAMLAGMR